MDEQKPRYLTIGLVLGLIALVSADMLLIHAFELTEILYFAIASGIEGLLVIFLFLGERKNRQKVLQDTKLMAETHEKEVIRLEEEAKDQLEREVHERTWELEVTLRELSEANKELERLTSIDPLTGIKNRRYFDKKLLAEGRRSRRERTELSLAMIDIDHFKRINDEHGHDVGDKCIQHVANIAKSILKRPSDDLCRYGGEEFALILPNTQSEGAFSLVEMIRQKIETTPCDIHLGELKMTVSAGVVSGIVERDSEQLALFKRADEALYDAKESGRNQVKISQIKETQ